MPKGRRSNVKMGTMEMLTLYLLQQKDLYGYQLTLLLRKLSDGKLDVAEATLYPTLYKLLHKGYISDREEPIGKRRVRVYYHLEAPGEKRLADLLEDYAEISKGIDDILHAKVVLKGEKNKKSKKNKESEKSKENKENKENEETE